MRNGSDYEDAVWTIPNSISFARIALLLPLSLGLIASGYYGWALLTLVLLGLTDWVDGAIARKFDQTSRLGSELDPVADRASILLISFALVFSGILPWEAFAVIVAVDALIMTLSLAWFNGYPPTKVNLFGKVRTALLLMGLPLLLLAAALDNEILRVAGLVIVGSGVAVHCVAGFTYVQQMLSARKKSQEALRYSGNS